MYLDLSAKKARLLVMAKDYLPISLFCAIAFSSALFIGGNIPLSIDEINYIKWSDPHASIRELFECTAYEAPLFFILLSRWQLYFGQKDIILRILPAFFSALCPFVVYSIVKKRTAKWPALTASFTIAISPALTYYGSRIDRYSLYIFLILSCFFSVHSIIGNSAIKKKKIESGSILFSLWGSLAMACHTAITPYMLALYLWLFMDAKIRFVKEKAWNIALPFVVHLVTFAILSHYRPFRMRKMLFAYFGLTDNFDLSTVLYRLWRIPGMLFFSHEHSSFDYPNLLINALLILSVFFLFKNQKIEYWIRWLSILFLPPLVWFASSILMNLDLLAIRILSPFPIFFVIMIFLNIDRLSYFKAQLVVFFIITSFVLAQFMAFSTANLSGILDLKELAYHLSKEAISGDIILWLGEGDNAIVRYYHGKAKIITIEKIFDDRENYISARHMLDREEKKIEKGVKKAVKEARQVILVYDAIVASAHDPKQKIKRVLDEFLTFSKEKKLPGIEITFYKNER